MATPVTPRSRLNGRSLLAGFFVLAAGGFVWFGTAGPGARHIGAGGDAVTLAGDERAKVARGATVPLIERGGLPTRIVIPKAGVDTAIAEVGVVLEDGRPVWETAWRSAGHHMDSAMPGQAGNMVISGHVSVADRSNVAVFESLDSVAEGDVIEVYSGDRVFRYAVKKVSVTSPSSVKLLRSSQDATITLVSCTRDLESRLVVVGTLISV